MASDKVNWLLVASVLIGCFLVSTEANDDQTVDELVKRLVNKGDDLEPETVEEMLQGHGNQQDEILGHSIEKLVGACKLSLENCSPAVDINAGRLERRYYDEIPNLYMYISHKRRQLERYCSEQHQKLRENFLASLKNEDEELVRSFMSCIKRDEGFQMLPVRYLVKSNTDAYRRLVDKIGGVDEKDIMLSKLERFFNELDFVCSLEPEKHQKALSSDDLLIKDSSAESSSGFVAANMRYLCYIARSFSGAADNIRSGRYSYLFN